MAESPPNLDGRESDPEDSCDRQPPDVVRDGPLEWEEALEWDDQLECEEPPPRDDPPERLGPDDECDGPEEEWDGEFCLPSA